jgi:F-type H+-transporting ATPase subunit a
MVFVLIFGVGWIRLGPKGFLKNLYPEGSPLGIGLFVAFLELVGLVTKSAVLSLRLFANMFAGHLAILSFLVLMMIVHPAFFAVSLPFAVFTYLLEVLISLIQALVFTLLSCLFIHMASASHELSSE